MPDLTAVEGGKSAKRPSSAKKKTVTQATKRGSRREVLVAMRNRIALAVESEDTLPRDLAALTKRLDDIDREIRAIDDRAAEEAEEERARRDSPDEDWDDEAI